ncbi:Nramp family divalent metal transporter [Glaciimonas sp. PAMC28666]|uniref:Nramp family divalent metal transporter n=1 Tax=Glaciimonas sp. PAMC28666 TaxID=2807626 RepID=UPI001962EE4E|nr:Nramp family divalent metal transporter [Glaciimonas sp. PAMC28666]QRX83640.1 Nramp family divalent metal transporter [Glaciimonas sp. PAMC28666]
MPPPALTLAPDWVEENTTELALTNATNTIREVPVRASEPWLRRLFAFIGPGYLVAVGYMDPGNWATDLAGGSAYGYKLLWIVMASSFMAMVLQILSAKLGIVAGMDLAQLCRKHSSPRSTICQWLLCEVAICACDIAEVIGTAIALKLLFNIPLAWGVALTVLDVLVILWLQKCGFRYLEAFVISLLSLVFICFSINLLLSQPAWTNVFSGFIPTSETVTNPGMLYLAIGIIGATVMPHNLYLHSSTVQTRKFAKTSRGKREAITFATVDIVIALCLALFVNAAILITSAAVFHAHGQHGIAELQDAYRLIGPLTGSTIASFLFALALLASGQSSSVTATMAGQIIMEGYVNLKMSPWARRLITRSLAIIPALFVTLICGEAGIGKLLLFSQVVLSLQLPFAMAPLIRFTSNKNIMGEFTNSRGMVVLAWITMVIIVCLNVILIWKALF